MSCACWVLTDYSEKVYDDTRFHKDKQIACKSFQIPFCMHDLSCIHFIYQQGHTKFKIISCHFNNIHIHRKAYTMTIRKAMSESLSLVKKSEAVYVAVLTYMTWLLGNHNNKENVEPRMLQELTLNQHLNILLKNLLLWIHE